MKRIIKTISLFKSEAFLYIGLARQFVCLFVVLYVNLRMLELSCRFQTRYDDSWYSGVKQFFPKNLYVHIKHVLKFYIHEIIGCKNYPIDFKLTNIIPLSVRYLLEIKATLKPIPESQYNHYNLNYFRPS